MGSYTLKNANSYAQTLTGSKVPDTIIDTNRLLFKPRLSLPQVPSTPVPVALSEWKDIVDLGPEELEMWEEMTRKLEAAVPPSLPPVSRKQKDPGSLLDMSGLLFKPLSRPQIPLTSPLAPAPGSPDEDPGTQGWGVWEELTQQLEV